MCAAHSYHFPLVFLPLLSHSLFKCSRSQGIWGCRAAFLSRQCSVALQDLYTSNCTGLRCYIEQNCIWCSSNRAVPTTACRIAAVCLNVDRLQPTRLCIRCWHVVGLRAFKWLFIELHLLRGSTLGFVLVQAQQLWPSPRLTCQPSVLQQMLQPTQHSHHPLTTAPTTSPVFCQLSSLRMSV